MDLPNVISSCATQLSIMKKFTLTIQDIRTETKETKTLCFKQPGLRKIRYKAGQYITLLVKINGRKYSRPYSFSSSPSVDSLLEVTIKRIPKGIVSNYIHNELKVGDVVEVIEPLGDFTYDINLTQTVYFWGIGSGITPLYSIIKESLYNQPNRVIHLIYGNKNHDTTIFRKELKNLQQEYSAFMSITNVHSQMNSVQESNNGLLKGRISSNVINQLLRQDNDCKESLHYICGPKSLKDKIISSLLDLGIPRSSIFAELFELEVSPNELLSVQESTVSLIFNETKYKFIVPRGKSVLDGALDKDIDLPYSCQTGNCSACKARLTNGELKMLGSSELRNNLQAHDFLLCCSYPLTSVISVEVK
jgi:ring-1,2-phenylacetyl-CoA epoxidase subunit PaaE